MTAIPSLPRCRIRLTLAAVLALAVGSLLLLRVLPGHALDEGIVRTLWMTPTEVQASQDRHRSPLVWRCVQDHLRGQRFDLSAVHTDASALGGGAG